MTATLCILANGNDSQIKATHWCSTNAMKWKRKLLSAGVHFWNAAKYKRLVRLLLWTRFRFHHQVVFACSFHRVQRNIICYAQQCRCETFNGMQFPFESYYGIKRMVTVTLDCASISILMHIIHIQRLANIYGQHQFRLVL